MDKYICWYECVIFNDMENAVFWWNINHNCFNDSQQMSCSFNVRGCIKGNQYINCVNKMYRVFQILKCVYENQIYKNDRYKDFLIY